MHAELTVSTGVESTRLELQPGQRIVLGRGLESGVRLEDEDVSRTHAAFTFVSTRLYVTDLDSRHGTFLDDQRLAPGTTTLVLPGSTVRVGDYQIAVSLVGLDESERVFAKHQLERVGRILPGDAFEVLGRLGSGSLGRVWAARRLADGKTVAVKVLRAELEPNSEAMTRFLREAELLRTIRSPYVVELYGAGTEAGKPYIVIELVHGPSVKDRLEREGVLPIPEALGIGEDVARALHAIATVGVVHRDVKPQNILLSPQGTAKLTDFGIAKARGSQDDPITGLGLGLGTLSYLAPEQASDARSVDSRADLYGLGATLYHLIAGRPPLLSQESGTSLNVLEAIRDGEPVPVRTLRPDCPQQVAELVQALLAKDPAERPQPAIHVAGDLRTLRDKLYPDAEDSLDDTASRGFRVKELAPPDPAQD